MLLVAPANLPKSQSKPPAMPPLKARNRSVHDTRTRVGTLLRELRSVKGLTRADFATIVQYSTSRISQIETGDRPCSREYIVKVATALELAPEQIIELTLCYAADVLARS